MKHPIIFSAFVVILVAAGLGTAQVSSLRVSFSESIDPSTGQGMGKVAYQDTLYNPNFRVFEVLIPASTAEQCFAGTDFSAARPVGPERASLSYNFSNLSYELKIVIPQEEQNRDGCRVILVGETAASAGYNTWRANFGRTSFADDALIGDEMQVRSGDGSVRFISYQVSTIYY